MKRLSSVHLLILLSLSGFANAHHGDDFILLEDYSMPAVWRPQITGTLDWERFGSVDTLQTEPTLYFTPLPRVGFSLAARFADETGDWALSAITPRVHLQLTDPKSKFPIRVGLSIGYQFGFGGDEEALHDHGGTSAAHAHGDGHSHASSTKTKNGQKASAAAHDHGDHSHDQPASGSSGAAAAPHDHAGHSHAAPSAPVAGVPVTPDPNAPHDHSTHDHGPTPCDPLVDVDCEGLLIPAADPVPAPPANAQATPTSAPSTAAPAAAPAPVESAPQTASAPPAEAAPVAEAPSQGQSNRRKEKEKSASKKSSEKRSGKSSANARSSGAHAHSHNQNQWIGRLVVEANFGSTKILANLIGTLPEGGEPLWGYAAGVRHQFTPKLALGVEAIGDFIDHGQHEIILGGYMTPVHSLTFKIGAGFGLTEASPDFALRSGFVVRF